MNYLLTEKESTSINKSPTPVMYAWSICTRLYDSTSLDHECKVVCVKFLNSLHFLHLFIYSSTSRKYLGHHASNFILFCVATTSLWKSSCTLFITNFLCVSGEIIRSSLQIFWQRLWTPWKIANLIVHLRVELNFLWHIQYQSQMPLILLPILVFSLSWLWVILF